MVVDVVEVDEYRMTIYRSMTERVWQARVEQMAREAGWYFYHTVDSRRSYRGYPDLHLIREGESIYAELKTEKGTLSADQIYWRDELIACGYEWYCWRPHMEHLIEERLNRQAVPVIRGEHQCGALCCCKPMTARKRSTSRSTTPRRKRSSRGSTASPK